MANPTSQTTEATYADVEALPEHVVGELIEGELIVSPRPAPRHALAASTLLAELHTPFQRGQGGPGGWWILFEPELHLPRKRGKGFNALVPDLAGWRKERMPALPQEAAFTLPPDWICEVRSISTAKNDLKKKLPEYARHGVPYVWYTDPDARTLSIFKLAGGLYQLVITHSDDDRVRAEPFEAAELDLLALWGETRPTGEET
jgi:Uma2 family endonuclease